MKVCIIRNGYFPIDPRVRKEVYAHRDKGHEVDVICLSNSKKDKKKEIIDGINIYRLPLSHQRKNKIRYILEYGISFFLFSIFVTVLYFRKKYDYIQVNTMPDFLVYTTFFVKMMGAKVILDLHEPTPELWVTKYGDTGKFILDLQRRIETFAISYSHKTITVTEALKNRVGERGADKNKITVIPNVCEKIFTEYNVKNKPTKEGILKMVTHGSIEERYGHDLIIKAISELKNDYPGITLDIFGSGEFENHLKRLTAELKCEDKVIFKGFLPFEQMLNEISWADVGIIAMQRSPYSELIDTNKLYEYISMGIPVLHARLPVVEQNFDNSCLEYFEPGDYRGLKTGIIKLLKSPERRSELAHNASKKMESFSWDVTKEKYINTFS